MAGRAAEELIESAAFLDRDRAALLRHGWPRSEVHGDVAEALGLRIELREFIRRGVGVLLELRAARRGKRPADAQLHHRLHAGHADEDAAAVLREIRAARREPVEA